MTSSLDPDRRRTVLQGGRAKAYRPIPESERKVALAEGIEAYERGDFFLAHEILEPAWMGTADPGERDLLQGLIKLSAAFVHGARLNPAGVSKNLRGASDRLAGAAAAGRRAGIDVHAIQMSIAARLAEMANGEDTAEAIAIARLPGGP